MIPKIIHYCWLSNDAVPEELLNYMATWKEHLAGYEFVKWDFSRFDINSSAWVKEAFENKKYAFAADYIRMYALYTMGGIYLDMDVEVLKPYDDLLSMNYFICYENGKEQVPEMAALGVCKGCEWVGYILDYYKDRHFIKSDGTFDTKPLPQVARTVLQANGMTLRNINSPKDAMGGVASELNILPCEYFSPKSHSTGKTSITSNTYSIHQFSGSWVPWEQRMERKLWLALGLRSHRVMWHVDKWLGKLFHIKR